MNKDVININQDAKTILNGIRSQASQTYKDTVPILVDEAEMKTLSSSKNVMYNTPATYTADLQLVGRAITDFVPNQNEFISALINRIGLVIFKNMSYTNPLKAFKRGTLSYGETIEEIFVGLAKSYDYNWNSGAAEENPFKREIPDVKTYFHTMNVQKVFKGTTAEQEISLAFTNSTGIYNLVNKIIQSIFTAYEVFEYERTKGLLKEAFDANQIVKINVDAATDEATAKKLIQKARSTSSKMQFPSKSFNSAGVMQTSPRGDQLILMTPDLEALVDVNVLASAFNMDKTEFLGKRVVIDAFPEGMEKVQLMIVDKDWFMIYDKLLRMESIYNPAQMYWNYFLHYWGVYSYSVVENAVAFVSA